MYKMQHYNSHQLVISSDGDKDIRTRHIHLTEEQFRYFQLIEAGVRNTESPMSVVQLTKLLRKVFDMSLGDAVFLARYLSQCNN